MAIQFPPDAEISTDHRLTLIRVLKELTKDNGRLDELVDAVKRTLKSKGRRYAESELVVADLRGGGGAGPRFVDPHKLYGLVKSKRITLKQFLDVIAVRTSLLPPILSGDEIKSIYRPAQKSDGDDAGALYTEFKPDVKVDFELVEAAILRAAHSDSGKKAA